MDTETVNEYSIIYKVSGTQQLHNQLQNDSEFFKKFVSENSCSLEMQVPENVTQDDDWTWNKRSVILFLDILERNKPDLRNTKIKRKDLWKKIKDEMVKHGFKNIDETMVERKFRNMKATYKTIKENRKKSGSRGEIKWDYYEAMDKIFEDDHTFDNGHTNLSMQSELPTTLKPAVKNIDIIIDGTPIDTVHRLVVPKLEPNKSQNNTIGSYFCATTPVPSSNRTSHGAPSETNLASVSAENTQEGAKTKKKNGRFKQLYGLRKKQLDFEKQRVKELQLIREAVEKSNAIQAERNNLLRLFLDRQR